MKVQKFVQKIFEKKIINRYIILEWNLRGRFTLKIFLANFLQAD